MDKKSRVFSEEFDVAGIEMVALLGPYSSKDKLMKTETYKSFISENGVLFSMKKIYGDWYILRTKKDMSNIKIKAKNWAIRKGKISGIIKGE